ncbi:MAG: hypothetical protein KatS3mg011_0032 [Acidimicrobiia bacterium]|nr:MAG: hypothetical protein KatS3mg011_0032 [Acidimicrobiia bacterium]
MNIYVGNLPFSYGSEDLSRLFAQYGEVEVGPGDLRP